MRFNPSNVPQIFYRLHDQEPMHLMPRFCLDEDIAPRCALSQLRQAETLETFLEKTPRATVCFYRTYALGDIIVLTPIFNSIKERFPDSKVVLVTDQKFLKMFKYWDLVEVNGADRLRLMRYDIGYFLDGVVEKDHKGNRFSYMHRLDIYCDSLGFSVPKEPIFSMPYSDEENSWAEETVKPLRTDSKPVMVFQFAGAMWFNHFSNEKILRIADGLRNDCKIVFVHNYPQDIKLEGTLNLCGKTTVHQLAALINSADVVLTMDSGALWVAHTTKTPIIPLFGHTRAKEKMAHHRNYHAIDLATMVGCTSCWGQQSHCGGKVNCINASDVDSIVTEIRAGLKKLVV